MVIRWSETAANDLEDIYDFIARDNPQAAAATVDRLIDVVERLENFPQMGRSAEFGTREIVIPPFVVVYRIIGEVINIEAVFHGSRRP
jgi:toxin ParE1/3/4